MGERLLHVTHSHLSLFINTDLKPCVNNRIRPFVNGYIKPAVNVLAEHIWRDLHTIIQWTASTESLDSILVSLEGTALHSFGVAVTRWTNGRRADVGRFWTFWTCVLLISFVSVLILILWLLFTQIWRGVARVYAIVIEPKSLIARVWGWVWRIAIVGVIAGISWRIVVVKGEQHFGNIDDL